MVSISCVNECKFRKDGKDYKGYSEFLKKEFSISFMLSARFLYSGSSVICLTGDRHVFETHVYKRHFHKGS